MSSPYLVYGGTGTQGGAVVRALLADGARVRLITRAPDRSPFADTPGVETVAGDLGDPASLARASRGAVGIYLVLPTVYDFDRVTAWGRNAIDAAAAAGVEVLVLNTSSVVPAVRTGVAALDIRPAIEDHLQRAAVPSVILRSTLYMGNLAGPWTVPALVHQGVLAYPLPAEQRVAWISWEEAAAYAVAALRRPGLAATKPVLATGGAQALTGPDLAAILGRVLGRPVRYQPLPLADFEAGLNAALGAPAGTEIAGFYRWIADPTNASLVAPDLAPVRAALPVPQVGFEDWARTIPWTRLAEVAA